MRNLLWWATVVALVVFSNANEDNGIATQEKTAKLISAFQVVTFPNDLCVGGNSMNGTCYTAEECENKGGTSGGSCADGFGVCCTFKLDCGESIAENNTYFETQQLTGACSVKICPCNTDICKIRLDLDTFVITGPVTITTSQFVTVAGVKMKGPADPAAANPPNPPTNVKGNINTNCATDSFTVTSGGTPVPVICGTMTGEHIYVDAREDCNDLTFNLGTTPGTGSSNPAPVTRSWKIKVTQYDCNSENLPPTGCHQWFYGGTKGVINTFNYQGSHHLANQMQNICIRREFNKCRICYDITAAGDFEVSGKSNSLKGYTGTSVCCGYGTTGLKTSGYDCMVIPGASKKADNAGRPSQFCGRILATAEGAIAALSVCSKSTPFMVTFISDGFEIFNAIAANSEMTAADAGNDGFRLSYEQFAC